MINRYSLADHTAKITLPAGLSMGGVDLGGKVITIGGPGQNGQHGSFVGSIAVSRAANMWSTTGDPTGSWVHNKNLDLTGAVTLSIRQVSDDVIRLMMISNIFAADNDRNGKGCKIEVFSGDDIVSRAEDCYIVKVPNQNFGESAENQEWEWTAGYVTFPMPSTWPQESLG